MVLHKVLEYLVTMAINSDGLVEIQMKGERLQNVTTSQLLKVIKFKAKSSILFPSPVDLFPTPTSPVHTTLSQL